MEKAPIKAFFWLKLVTTTFTFKTLVAHSIQNIANHLSHVCLQGFGKLKQYVPDLKSKSSKVETLRGAIDYIRRLKELLGEDVADLCTPVPKIELEDDDGKQRHNH